MLFLSYWELYENITPKELAELAAELMEKNLWPVEGTEILGFYVTTDVPVWGITIEEAENVETLLKGAAVWTNAKPGVFKVLKVSPAMTAEDAIPIIMGMQIQSHKPLDLPSFLCCLVAKKQGIFDSHVFRETLKTCSSRPATHC